MQRLGRFELHALSDGFFKLDGGAVFGIVPKPVWSKVLAPDDQNRVRLHESALLVRTGAKNILCEAGIGDRKDPTLVERFGIEKPSDLLRSLAAIGLSPADIDVVIPSHLHFDHAGWLCTKGEPTFPKATVVVQEGGWEEALSANARTQGSYMRGDFLPLEKARRLKVVKGDEEIVPGVTAVHTAGHVGHHQSTFVESQGKKAAFVADVFPTSHHLRPAWVMGFDLQPAELAALKERWLPQAAKEEWLCAFVHDPQVAMGYIRQDARGFRVETVERVPA